jgi:hypothetical protein
MQPLPGFQTISRLKPRWSRAGLLALGALIAVLALAFGARPAAAAPAEQTCPNFRVLHNTRIGAAILPAGNYTITLDARNLNCSSGADLFARFLEDFDGVLPAPWRVSPEGSGMASFLRSGRPGFSVELTGKSSEEGGKNPDLGELCPKPFMVTETTVIRPLRFTKGKFLIYLPAGSGITCRRAAILFTRFLDAGTLPEPWELTSQTATFYKPSHPTRSAFRIEPLSAGRRR